MPADNHNITGEYDPAFHSTDGVVSVSLPSYPQVEGGPFREAAAEQGIEFDLDVNDGVPLGVGEKCTSWISSARSNAAIQHGSN